MKEVKIKKMIKYEPTDEKFGCPNCGCEYLSHVFYDDDDNEWVNYYCYCDNCKHSIQLVYRLASIEAIVSQPEQNDGGNNDIQ